MTEQAMSVAVEGFRDAELSAGWCERCGARFGSGAKLYVERWEFGEPLVVCAGCAERMMAWCGKSGKLESFRFRFPVNRAPGASKPDGAPVAACIDEDGLPY